MDPITQLTAIAGQSSDHTDWSSPIGVIIIVILIIIAAYPLMQVYKKWNNTQTDAVKESIESYLYKHLQEQIKENHQYLKETREENEKLKRIIVELEIRIKKLESDNMSVTKLKEKIDEKDAEILGKDALLAQREMKIHELFDIVMAKESEINALTYAANTAHTSTQF